MKKLLALVLFSITAVGYGEQVTAHFRMGSNDTANTPATWQGALCPQYGANGVLGTVSNLVGVQLEPWQGDFVQTVNSGVKQCVAIHMTTYNATDGFNVRLTQNAQYTLDLQVNILGTYQSYHIDETLYTILGQYSFFQSLGGPSSVISGFMPLYVKSWLSQ